jgi:hypothetical protein
VKVDKEKREIVLDQELEVCHSLLYSIFHMNSYDMSEFELN